jgi:hypothetical protein
MPVSFEVLANELRGLALNIELRKVDHFGGQTAASVISPKSGDTVGNVK